MKQYLLGESVQGFSHIRSNLECQDSCKHWALEDGTVILAAADGHGSKSCPFSKTGSEIAVNLFCDKMAELYGGFQNAPDRLPSYLNQEGTLKFAQDVERDWKASVMHAHVSMKREIPLTDDGQENFNAVYRLYGTTLLGLLITSTFVFAFQIGDGDISYVDVQGFQTVVTGDKLLGVESHSLCSTNAWKKAVSSVQLRSWDQNLPCVFMLSTDGFANSFVNDEEYEKTCVQYFETLNKYGANAVEEKLKFWLAETSRLGCGDDTTLLMAYFTADHQETESKEFTVPESGSEEEISPKTVTEQTSEFPVQEV